MLDIGWTELLLIGIVALIVVGPKDLPGMFRQLGRFTAKIKGMARDFQRAMDEAADDAGVKDVASDLRSATSSKNLGLDSVTEAATKFEDWDPSKPRKVMGSESAKLASDRAEAARKIHSATAKAAETRLADEAAAKTAASSGTGAAKPAAKTAAKSGSKPAAKAAKPKAAPKTAAKTASKAAPKTAPKTAAKTAPKTAPKTAAKAKPKAAAKTPKADT